MMASEIVKAHDLVEREHDNASGSIRSSCWIIVSFISNLSYFLLVCDVAHVRRLKEENASLARILEEKETAARDKYDKALADRLSIVAEGLAGNAFGLAPRALCFMFSDHVRDIANHPQVFLA